MTTVDPTQAACKSCTTAVFWAETVHGKPMLVDVEQTTNGNLRIQDRPGLTPLATVVPRHLAFGQLLHVSHFVNCPGATSHRRASGSTTPPVSQPWRWPMPDLPPIPPSLIEAAARALAELVGESWMDWQDHATAVLAAALAECEVLRHEWGVEWGDGQTVGFDRWRSKAPDEHAARLWVEEDPELLTLVRRSVHASPWQPAPASPVDTPREDPRS